MLTGKLVRLRKNEPEDLPRIVRWINDPEVTRYIAARYPYSEAQEQGWLDRVSTQPPSQGVVLAIETLDSAQHIGTVSLNPPVWEDRSASLGIMIGEAAYWGRGFGTDAILTLLRFAFEAMGLHRVHLDVLADNERAIASYRKCGFVVEGSLRQAYYQAGRYHDLIVMGVLEHEFFAADGPTVVEAS